MNSFIYHIGLIHNIDYSINLCSFFTENPINCDCELQWLVSSQQKMRCFSNFKCADKDLMFYSLQLKDLGDCKKIESTKNKKHILVYR